MRPHNLTVYVDKAGRLTREGLLLLQDQAARIEALETRLAAIAAVAAPTGGTTTDTEARAAISSIIAGAA